MEGEEVLSSPLQAYTKNAPTILAAYNKPTELHQGAPDPREVLPPTRHVELVWRTRKPQQIGVAIPSCDFEEVPGWFSPGSFGSTGHSLCCLVARFFRLLLAGTPQRWASLRLCFGDRPLPWGQGKRYVLGAPRKVPSAKRTTRYSPSAISSAFLQCLFGGGAGQNRSLGGSSISSASKPLLRFSSSSNNRCSSCRSSVFGVARREMGFQAILVPSLFQKVFGSCTCICRLFSLFGSHWSMRPYWFGCDAKAAAWLSRILSSPFVAQTQTIGPSSTSCSTALLRPVCVARTPNMSRSFPARSAIFFVSSKSAFRRRAWLRSFALEPCGAPVWRSPVALALLP